MRALEASCEECHCGSGGVVTTLALLEIGYRGVLVANPM